MIAIEFDKLKKLKRQLEEKNGAPLSHKEVAEKIGISYNEYSIFRTLYSKLSMSIDEILKEINGGREQDELDKEIIKAFFNKNLN
jgi:DNA-directed RNA polymerase specialized sigma subunit